MSLASSFFGTRCTSYNQCRSQQWKKFPHKYSKHESSWVSDW